jgi:hypothetical protein
MSLGDYVSVFVSIILGIALGDLLMSAHRLLRARSRVEWHWVSPTLALYMLLQVTAVWWASFRWYRKLGDFTIGAFLLDVALYASLFLATASVLPDEIPDGRFSLKEYYFREARYFWSVMILWTIAIIVPWIIEMPRGSTVQAALAYQGQNIFYVLLMIPLLITKRAWVHYSVVAILFVLNVIDYLPGVLGKI